MFVIFVYFAFILRKISVFFDNYVNSGNFIYVENMVKDYVPWYSFLLIILIVVGALCIYLLIKQKNKPTVYYRFLIIYSIIVLGVFIYFYLFFSNIKNVVYEPLKIVINRDVATAVYIVNYFYVVFSFIRGFGFDIKKFSFNKDQKEFEFDEADNEEFEVNVDVDRKDVNAKLRRGSREVGYIIKENAKVLVIMAIVVILLFVGYFYINNFVLNKVYKDLDTIVIGKMSYKVRESYLTNLDKYGNDIGENFVLINLNIKNSGENITLAREKFRIKVQDKYYYPVYNYYKLFDDLGNYYDNSTIIKGNSNQQYLLIFDIGEERDNQISLEILRNKDNGNYVVIKIKPSLDKKNTSNYKLNDELIVNDVTLNVNSFEIVDRDSYQYNECKNDVCNTFTKTIIPELNQLILKLNIVNSSRLSDAFWENSLKINYDNKEISSKQIKLLGRKDDMIYFGVSKNVLSAKLLYAVINTRDTNINILLRG